ncbi:hypothetical protein IM543_21055 [Massilia sp. UMI-21]|nr:hypothetical protein IM543_21055 [Massilia sp. UMI-21]
MSSCARLPAIAKIKGTVSYAAMSKQVQWRGAILGCRWIANGSPARLQPKTHSLPGPAFSMRAALESAAAGTGADGLPIS